LATVGFMKLLVHRGTQPVHVERREGREGKPARALEAMDDLPLKLPLGGTPSPGAPGVSSLEEERIHRGRLARRGELPSHPGFTPGRRRSPE
jgi:hypothetical protein